MCFHGLMAHFIFVLNKILYCLEVLQLCLKAMMKYREILPILKMKLSERVNKLSKVK